MNHINKRKNTYLIATASTAALFALSIITASSMATIPAAASTTLGNNSSTTTASTATLSSPSSPSPPPPSLPPAGLELPAQPVWDEQVWTTSITPINQTHSMAAFEGNGTMMASGTGETINMTNNGTAIGSILPQANNTVISYGRENVFSVDDGDTSAITFFEIVRYDHMTFEGKGLAVAVFDNNSTGSLAPFNGMLVVGTHEEDPSTQTVTIRLWEWESGIPIPTIASAITSTLEESSTPSPMETPTAEDLTADDSTATTTTIPIPEEEGEGQ